MEFNVGIIFFLAVIGAVVFIIFQNRTKFNEINEDVPRKYRETKDLSSSLDDSLNNLNKNQALANQKEKKRKDFINKHYKLIAGFYNNYKFIDYAKKENRKIAKKQMLDIVNVLDKNLEIMENYFNKDSSFEYNYQIIIVGVVTFKFMNKETVNKVNKHLKILHDLNQKTDLPSKLVAALDRILT
jgi:Sec-independent protein translocase protein TatA